MAGGILYGDYGVFSDFIDYRSGNVLLDAQMLGGYMEAYRKPASLLGDGYLDVSRLGADERAGPSLYRRDPDSRGADLPRKEKPIGRNAAGWQRGLHKQTGGVTMENEIRPDVPAQMQEKIYDTPCGKIHYWVDDRAEKSDVQLVFLPGLTADHRLFDKQIEYFEGKYPVLVWDAPGHAASWPFALTFSLLDKAKWLDEILTREGFDRPILIGQSMGGYVGQAYAHKFPEKLCGFVSIDSAPLQREYVTGAEIWLLKKMEPVYRHYPWKALLRSGSNGVAVTKYGKKLMREMMLVYAGDQARYAALSGHGYRMLAEAMEADLPYRIPCPALLICGEKDRAGSCIRYNKAWHRKTGIPLEWVKNAGHNSNTDAPETVNRLIEKLISACRGKA